MILATVACTFLVPAAVSARRVAGMDVVTSAGIDSV